VNIVNPVADGATVNSASLFDVPVIATVHTIGFARLFTPSFNPDEYVQTVGLAAVHETHGVAVLEFVTTPEVDVIVATYESVHS
jgi:hypothetical protein